MRPNMCYRSRCRRQANHVPGPWTLQHMQIYVSTLRREDALIPNPTTMSQPTFIHSASGILAISFISVILLAYILFILFFPSYSRRLESQRIQRLQDSTPELELIPRHPSSQAQPPYGVPRPPPRTYQPSSRVRILSGSGRGDWSNRGNS